MSKYLEVIKTTAKLVSDDELIQLRIEEELLINFVKKSDISLTIKKDAFERVKEINHMQLRILGA